MPDKGYYGMYTYGRGSRILNPRAESLGEALAILYDIAPKEHQKSISENSPQAPFGAPVFYPQISDMPNYHNNALWPGWRHTGLSLKLRRVTSGVCWRV